ncbi:MAG: beta-lactamase family protein [Verrucomicrobia bacterium]|nr:beta-lactamase family protein [Verrucomicrobiota bacterium]
MKPNRRTFLKQAGCSAAGLSLLPLLSACRGLQVAAAADGPLPRGTPEAEGISSAAILAFLDAVAQSQHEFHSFMLVRHGRVVAEGWWSPYAPPFRHTLYSLSKSFTSTAVGFAVSEGRLRVGDRVISFFPDELPARVSEHLAALRVRDLLTMSVGNAKEPVLDMVKTEDWVRAFLATPIPHPPGSVFLYNSSATYMLSAIVQRRTGQRIVDYLTPRLFAPLGIPGPTWETCPRGINTGGWGLSVRTEDLAKFGQFYRQKGRWHGRQLLPAAWIDEATTFKIQQPAPVRPQRPNADNDWLQGYCYQFWRCRHHAFRGDGAFGQYTMVMPEQDAVIAITSETHDMQGELDLVWEHLLPAMSDQPLPDDRATRERLERTLATLTLAPPNGQPTSPVAGPVSGKTFQLEPNALGLERVRFEFPGDRCGFTANTARAAYPVECGIGTWQRGQTALPGTPPRLISGGAPKPGTPARIAARGAWKDAHTFEMLWRYYETPHHDTVTCRFGDGGVQIAFVSSIAAMSSPPPDARPVLHGRLAG